MRVTDIRRRLQAPELLPARTAVGAVLQLLDLLGRPAAPRPGRKTAPPLRGHGGRNRLGVENFTDFLPMELDAIERLVQEKRVVQKVPPAKRR